jgi:hypothetical protein
MSGFIGTSVKITTTTAHNQWLRLAPFFTGLWVSSLLVWLTWFWFTNRSFLQLPLSAGEHSTAEHWTLLWMTNEECRMNDSESEPESYVTTDGQSVSRSVCLGIKHPAGAYVQIFITVRLLRVCWCGAEQSSSLLPATSQHGHSWHRAPMGPMTIYLFNVKTIVFLSLLSLFLLW